MSEIILLYMVLMIFGVLCQGCVKKICVVLEFMIGDLVWIEVDFEYQMVVLLSIVDVNEVVCWVFEVGYFVELVIGLVD